MKALAVLFLSLTVPGAHSIPALHRATNQPVTKTAHKGGCWYFAKSGHAVYCYGPVRLIPQADGDLERVATFCQGDRPMVPLQD